MSHPDRLTDHPTNPALAIALEHGDSVAFRLAAKMNPPSETDQAAWCEHLCKFHSPSWVRLAHDIGWAMPGNPITLIIQAARCGNSEALTALLELGHDACARNPMTGATALHAASFEGNTDCAAILLRAGCPIDALTDRGLSALILSVQQRNDDTADFLVDSGALWAEPVPGSEESAFHYACDSRTRYDLAAGWAQRHGRQIADQRWGHLCLVALSEAENDPCPSSRSFHARILSLREQTQLGSSAAQAPHAPRKPAL